MAVLGLSYGEEKTAANIEIHEAEIFWLLPRWLLWYNTEEWFE